MLWGWFGMALYLCLSGTGMYFAVRIEKYKKKYDIQTYKEIVAFTDGKSMDEIEKAIINCRNEIFPIRRGISSLFPQAMRFTH